MKEFPIKIRCKSCRRLAFCARDGIQSEKDSIRASDFAMWDGSPIDPESAIRCPHCKLPISHYELSTAVLGRPK